MLVAESQWLEPVDLCLATSMTCTITKELSEAEPWTPQHWSRAEWFRANGRHPRYKTAAEPSERILAVWLECKRHCQRIGHLSATRTRTLNLLVPSWQGP